MRLSNHLRLLVIIVAGILMAGCIGLQTKLIRSEASGSWEIFETKSGIAGNPGKMINSKTFGVGNNKYEKYGKPYLSVRESPSGQVDIIYFPGLQSPSRPSIKANQAVDVYAKYSADRAEYVYRFTADAVNGDLLFFTDFEMHALLKKLERESLVSLYHWDRLNARYVKNIFSLNGSPHVVVRAE